LSTAFIMSGCVIIGVIVCLLVVNGRLWYRIICDLEWDLQKIDILVDMTLRQIFVSLHTARSLIRLIVISVVTMTCFSWMLRLEFINPFNTNTSLTLGFVGQQNSKDKVLLCRRPLIRTVETGGHADGGPNDRGVDKNNEVDFFNKIWSYVYMSTAWLVQLLTVWESHSAKMLVFGWEGKATLKRYSDLYHDVTCWWIDNQ
jgi:hypothetical protein